jgi:hypothetical protein
MEFSQKQLSFGFVIVCLALLWALLKLDTMKLEIQKLHGLNTKSEKRADSLENELFGLELKLFKYEKAVKIFEEKNPDATSQLSDIISDETE